MRRRLTIWALAAGFAIGLWAQAPSQPNQGIPSAPDGQVPQDDPADAASHGVARVSFMNGNVSIARGDAGEMAGATLNDPMVTSDRILTNSGRAELQFDAFNLLRMAEGSEVRMGDLQYHRYQVQVARGLVIFRVLRDSDAQVEISLPSASVHPLRQGIYRVLVRPDGSCEITVRAGEAEVFSPTGSERLQAGGALLSRGPANDPEFMSASAPPFDDWDRFNSDRDRLFDRPADAGRYTAPDVYGTEDLNNHGRWVDDPSYGNVWVPNVNSDWAPYENGRWTWLDYYGWTWVSYDPWGWAPYHYGNWYRSSRFGWAWYPGVNSGRHYWRPAMVGFVGWGTPGFGTSVGFGFSNIGWVPLAPREPFRPWYGRGYGRGFAGGSIISVNVNSYQNARYVNGVTGVRAGDFGRGNNFFRASSNDLSHAGALNGPVTINRPRTSMGFSAPTSSRSSFFSAPTGSRGNNGNDGWRRMNGASSGFASPRNGQAVQISPPIVNDRGVNDRGENRNQPYNGNRSGFDRGNGYRENGFGGPRPNYNPQGNGQPNYPQNYRSMPQQQPAQQPQMQQRAPEMRAPQMRGPMMRPERGGGGGQPGGGQPGGGGFRGGNPGGGGNGGGGGHQGGGGGGHGRR